MNTKTKKPVEKLEPYDYDKYLKETYGGSTIDFLIWAASLPFFIRFLLRKYISGLSYLGRFTSFVARNPNHELTREFYKIYRKATFKEYHIRDEFISLYFDDKKKVLDI